jgi:hypothetical protein
VYLTALATIAIALTGIADQRLLVCRCSRKAIRSSSMASPGMGSWIRRLENGQQQIFVQEDWLDGALGIRAA